MEKINNVSSEVHTYQMSQEEMEEDRKAREKKKKMFPWRYNKQGKQDLAAHESRSFFQIQRRLRKRK